jgi:hypothetical protein
MTDDKPLAQHLQVLQAAATSAAGSIIARDRDGSFLEKTMRDALAVKLPHARTEQPLSLDQALWPGRLGGVDVLYVSNGGAHVGVETKVWDVADSLYDLFKLAAATQHRRLAVGFCVIAGRARDWRAPSAISDLSVTAPGAEVEHQVAALLERDERSWARIWSRSPIRPTSIPARVQTMASLPIAMPRAPDHEIRIIGVHAVGRDQLALDADGHCQAASGSPRAQRHAAFGTSPNPAPKSPRQVPNRA